MKPSITTDDAEKMRAMSLAVIDLLHKMTGDGDPALSIAVIGVVVGSLANSASSPADAMQVINGIASEIIGSPATSPARDSKPAKFGDMTEDQILATIKRGTGNLLRTLRKDDPHGTPALIIGIIGSAVATLGLATGAPEMFVESVCDIARTFYADNPLQPNA